MKKLRTKMKRQGGFTLVEMLIVVAIIAILIAVAIPLVNTALERAAKATDAANERSAKAVATVKYLTDNEDSTFDWDKAYFDADKGVLTNTKPAGYGKCSRHKNGYIVVSINENFDPDAEEDDNNNQLLTIAWDDITDAPSDGGEDWLDSKELTTGNGEIETTTP